MTAIPRNLPTGIIKLPALLHPDEPSRTRLQGQLFQRISPELGAFQVLKHVTGDYLRYMRQSDLSRTPTLLDPHPPFIATPLGSRLRSQGDGNDTYQLVMDRGQPIDELKLVSIEVARSLLKSAEIFADPKITPELVSDNVELARMYPFSGEPTLRVLTAEELTNLLPEGRLPPQLKESLLAMPPREFTETWTVLVFGLGGPDFEVLGVTKKDRAVTIHYREIPPKGGAYTTVVRAPAAFVTVREDDLPDGSRIELRKSEI